MNKMRRLILFLLILQNDTNVSNTPQDQENSDNYYFISL